jgi:ectoine hydroxylase-related dioxygenase (phytanoyl-CoA dioxygenase family)
VKRSVEDHVGDLRETGYTVYERLYDDAEVARLSSTMARLHAEMGSPSCYSREPKALGPEVELSTTGLVFYKFIKRCPENADLVARPEVIAAVRGFLGQDMWLEIAGAVIADRSRPFFAWHTHIGGPDDGKYRREKIFPRFEQPQRVMTVLYVNDLEDDNGPLLVHPRRVSDPTPPPHDEGAASWPGEVVLNVPRGSVVVLDQCTWHAVRQKRSEGIRSFVGCYFRSPAAPATEWVDDWLPGFEGGGDLLQSVLRPPGR